MAITAFASLAHPHQKHLRRCLTTGIPPAHFMRHRRYDSRSYMSQESRTVDVCSGGRGTECAPSGISASIPWARAASLNGISSRRATLQARAASGIYRESIKRETLISEAETMLAWQTPATFRCWFSYWRSRGVVVNDLLNMTWVWQQRVISQ